MFSLEKRQSFKLKLTEDTLYWQRGPDECPDWKFECSRPRWLLRCLKWLRKQLPVDDDQDQN